jgi:ELWxxDGT repeat protein
MYLGKASNWHLSNLTNMVGHPKEWNTMANFAALGFQLWLTDVTPQDTSLVRDNNPENASYITNYFELKSCLFND